MLEWGQWIEAISTFNWDQVLVQTPNVWYTTYRPNIVADGHIAYLSSILV